MTGGLFLDRTVALVQVEVAAFVFEWTVTCAVKPAAALTVHQSVHVLQLCRFSTVLCILIHFNFFHQ